MCSGEYILQRGTLLQSDLTTSLANRGIVNYHYRRRVYNVRLCTKHPGGSQKPRQAGWTLPRREPTTKWTVHTIAERAWASAYHHPL
jgi:hypothetical protein